MVQPAAAPQPPPQAQGPSLFQTAQDFLNSLPLFTRYLFVGTMLFSLGPMTGLISPSQIVLTPQAYQSYEIWRLVTCHMLSGGFPLLTHLYMLHMASSFLEAVHFGPRKADYAFFLFFVISILDVIGFIMETPVLTNSFGMTLIYMYSMLRGDENVHFMFGLQFQARYLPWAILIMDLVVGNAWMPALIGIVVGHLYYFLDILYPAQNNGSRIISTPTLFHTLFPPTQPPGVAPPVADGPRPWGRGQRLGT